MASLTPLTREELRDILGDEPEDLFLERIAATGATIDEVSEALNRLEAEESGDELDRTPSSAIVVEVAAILDEAMAPNSALDAEDAGYASR